MPSIDFGLLAVSALALAAPLVLAALGGLLSERSGVMNIALEGAMLFSACTAALVGILTRSPALGLAAALAIGTAVMSLHAVLTQVFRIDQIISGMALNALAAGSTAFVSKAFLAQSTVKAALFPSQVYWIAALLAVVAVALYMDRTRGGLWVLAVGNDPDKSRQMGIEPVRVRFGALATGGVLCGLAGALIVSNAGNFTENMTAGRGYIALAALIIGSWRAWPALAACLVFGLVEAVQLHLQGTKLVGAELPTQFWTSLPYLFTLVALAGLLGKSRPPAGLGKH
ncbi:MAG: ABC transporter permease [Armatimonadetes bacterium]|nr:ABC transporter permease [Armatimonadota bacterium]